MASEEHNMPFIRNLASSDRKIRTSALTSLRSFLSSRQTASSLNPLEILKLWKGLFYALWMCDRAVPQQNLCQELADLLADLPDAAVPAWLQGFWATMAREWTGIDVYRLNKFMLLVRRVLGRSFAWMKGAEGTWDAQRTDEVLALLEEWPFALEDEARPDNDENTSRKEKRRDANRSLGGLAPPIVPVGMKIHVLDIWVDEAEKVGLLETDDAEAAKILQRIIALADTLEDRTLSQAVRIRAKESLADQRLPGNAASTKVDARAADAETVDGDDDSWDGFED